MITPDLATEFAALARPLMAWVQTHLQVAEVSIVSIDGDGTRIHVPGRDRPVIVLGAGGPEDTSLWIPYRAPRIPDPPPLPVIPLPPDPPLGFVMAPAGQLWLVPLGKERPGDLPPAPPWPAQYRRETAALRKGDVVGHLDGDRPAVWLRFDAVGSYTADVEGSWYRLSCRIRVVPDPGAPAVAP